MASTKDVQICSLCKSHLQGRKEARFPNPSGKTTIINLDEKGEGLCRLCENNVCQKMFYTSLCQEIKRLKFEKKSIGERRELEELEQELAKLNVQPVPLKQKQVSDELSQMEKELDEEEEFKKLERQAESEAKKKVKMMKSPRKSPPKKEKKKGFFAKLFS